MTWTRKQGSHKYLLSFCHHRQDEMPDHPCADSKRKRLPLTVFHSSLISGQGLGAFDLASLHFRGSCTELDLLRVSLWRVGRETKPRLTARFFSPATWCIPSFHARHLSTFLPGSKEAASSGGLGFDCAPKSHLSQTGVLMAHSTTSSSKNGKRVSRAQFERTRSSRPRLRLPSLPMSRSSSSRSPPDPFRAKAVACL